MYLPATVEARFAHSAESDRALFEGKERVILALANVAPRQDAIATLADDYGAFFCLFSGIELNPEIFRI